MSVQFMRVLIPNALFLETTMRNASTRFCDAFTAAWERIPEDARIAISTYLQQFRGTVYLCYRMETDEKAREPWGRCHWWNDRTIITFLAPFVECGRPLDQVAEVVAHELGHCYTRGTDSWNENSEKEEANVRRILTAWGFSEPVSNPEADAAFETWRKRNNLEFGELTERWWVCR